MMRLKDIGETSVEPLDHAVGLWSTHLSQSVLDAQALAEQIKFMSIIGCFLSEDLVGKFLA